jgi:hypothetical protein
MWNFKCATQKHCWRVFGSVECKSVYLVISPLGKQVWILLGWCVGRLVESTDCPQLPSYKKGQIHMRRLVSTVLVYGTAATEALTQL